MPVVSKSVLDRVQLMLIVSRVIHILVLQTVVAMRALALRVWSLSLRLFQQGVCFDILKCLKINGPISCSVMLQNYPVNHLRFHGGSDVVTNPELIKLPPRSDEVTNPKLVKLSPSSDGVTAQ